MSMTPERARELARKLIEADRKQKERERLRAAGEDVALSSEELAEIARNARRR